MGVDVVNAEAVVTCAAGAISKFQVGMVGICPSAHLAAAIIGLCPLFVVDAVHFPLEVYSGFALAASAGTKIAEKLVAAEKKIVKHGNYGEEIYGEGAAYYAYDKNDRIHYCQPLHFYGYEEKQQNPHIGEEGGKGEKHGKIDILGGDKVAFSGDEIENKAIDNREKNTWEEIDIKARGAPAVLKSLADKVIEIEKDKGKQTCWVGYKGKGEKSPYLSLEDMGRGKGDQTYKGAGGIHHIEKPDDGVCNNNIKHKIGDAESGMLVAEEVNFFAEPFQIKSTPVGALEIITD